MAGNKISFDIQYSSPDKQDLLLRRAELKNDRKNDIKAEEMAGWDGYDDGEPNTS